MGRLADAEKQIERVLKIHRALVAADPADPAFRSEELARSYQVLGDLDQRTERLPQALAAYEDSRGLRQKLVDAFPGQARSPLRPGPERLRHRPAAPALRESQRRRPGVARPGAVTYRRVVARDPGEHEEPARAGRTATTRSPTGSGDGPSRGSRRCVPRGGRPWRGPGEGPARRLALPDRARRRDERHGQPPVPDRPALRGPGRLPAVARHREGRGQPQPVGTGSRRNLALSHAAIGSVLAETGQPAEALESLSQLRGF